MLQLSIRSAPPPSTFSAWLSSIWARSDGPLSTTKEPSQLPAARGIQRQKAEPQPTWGSSSSGRVILKRPMIISGKHGR